MAKKMRALTSSDYWAKREADNLARNQLTEQEYERRVNEILKYMEDQITKEINGFYAKYAKAEGITMAEAKRRVSQLDIAEYERKAERYVREKNFSAQANEEMRLYNATMKINRLELLKANIGLELVAGYDELDKYTGQILTDRAKEELERQAGILGNTVDNLPQRAGEIATASFNVATYSDRIWTHQAMLKSELDNLLREGLIQGRNPRVLARHLQKRFGVSRENALRLMRTELARVQTEAQKESYERNGYAEYEYIAEPTACPICKALNGNTYSVKDMTVGKNAPPMHPNCQCSTAAYMDRAEFEEWLRRQ